MDARYERIVNLQNQAMAEIKCDINKAMFLFELAYKEESNLQTIHNFGTFLSKYGEECELSYDARILAEEKLREALKISANYASYKELADLYLLQGRYTDAIDLYRNALEYNQTAGALVNLAICHYYEKEYHKLTAVINETFGLSIISDEITDEIYMLSSFGYALSGAIGKAKEMFGILTKKEEYIPKPESLWLAYLCGEYSYILKNYQAVMEDWFFDVTTFKTVYQAYLHTDKQRLEQFVRDYRKKVVQFYQENQDFDQEEKTELISAIDRGPYLPKIDYLPQFVWQVDFL